MAIHEPLYDTTFDPELEKQAMDTLAELDLSKIMPQLELRDGQIYCGGQPMYRLNDDDGTYILNDEMYTSPHPGKDIPMPSWASEENGCVPHKAIQVGNGIVVEYKPIRTMGSGYAKIYIVGKDNDQPFPRMKEIWEETHRIWSQNNPDALVGGTIAPTGEIRDQYGSNAPSFTILHGFLLNMNILYSNWKYFPNAKSYKKVEELKQALESVRAMDGSASYIENDIKDLREQIKSRQDEIAEREKQLNDLYETAADAMNLLEENGVKVDAKGKVEGVEDDGSEYISTLGMSGTFRIENSLTPCISIGRGYSTCATCKPDYDKDWTADEYSCDISGK